jgi:hypothetical protein
LAISGDNALKVAAILCQSCRCWSRQRYPTWIVYKTRYFNDFKWRHGSGALRLVVPLNDGSIFYRINLWHSRSLSIEFIDKKLKLTILLEQYLFMVFCEIRSTILVGIFATDGGTSIEKLGGSSNRSTHHCAIATSL